MLRLTDSEKREVVQDMVFDGSLIVYLSESVSGAWNTEITLVGGLKGKLVLTVMKSGKLVP